MGRKKLENPPTVVPEVKLPEQELMALANNMSKLEQAFSDEQRRATLLIGKRLGRRAMAQLVTKLLTVTDVVDLQRIKESKEYKGFTHIDEVVNRQPISTWDEYCEQIEGKSRQLIDLEISNLNQLGEELFESMRQVGLGPGKMREIRKLPDDSQVALLEAARDGDKETLLDLAEELIARHAKEKDEQNRRVTEAEGDRDAARQVAKKYREENDQFQIEIARLQHRHQRLQPPERAKELRGAIADKGLALDVELLGSLRIAGAELKKDAEESGIDHISFLGGIVRSLELTLQSVRDEFGLPTDGDFGWMNEAAIQTVLNDLGHVENE